MKRASIIKITFLLFLFLFLLSCQKQYSLQREFLVPFLHNHREHVSSRVTEEDISIQIERFCNLKGNLKKTRSLDDVRIDPILNHGDTVFYLVNYEEGWQLLSADHRAPEVLMMCLKGNISPEELSFNPIQEQYLKDAANMISEFLSSPIVLEDRNSLEQKDEGDRSQFPHDDDDWPYSRVEHYYTYEIQDHLTQTKWGQNNPWNVYAPRLDTSLTIKSLTGCAMVAAAQFLYFHHNSFSKTYQYYAAKNSVLVHRDGFLQLSENDILHSQTNGNYWSLMAKDSTESGVSYVSSLMIELGYHFQAKYKWDETSAQTSKVLTVLPALYGVSVDSSSDSTQFKRLLRNEIYLLQHPVIARLSGNSGNDRHAVVIDGMNRMIETYDYYRGRDSGLPVPGDEPDIIWQLVSSESYDWYYMVAINWGWDGNGDSNNDGNTIWYSLFSNWSAGGHVYNSLVSLFFLDYV